MHPSDEDLRKDWEKAEEKMRFKRQRKEDNEK
jgi:hypothetical protein